MSSSDSTPPGSNRAIPVLRAARSSPPSLRVYVSSTYQDLKDCRHAIRFALQRMGLDDIAMETYVADEDRPVDRCLDDVRSADLYIGVLAWRYGFVPNGEDRSITELEYRTAGEAGIPRLIFVLEPDAPWPRSAMDKDSSRVDAFRDHVLEAHVCDTFLSAEDLRAKVAEAVSLHLQDQHGITVGADAAWDAYCERLIQEYRRLDLEALTPPDRDEHLQIALRDVFVEPLVREDMPDTELPKELLRKLAETADSTSSKVPRGLDRYLVEQTRDSYRRQPARGAFDALIAPLARTCVLLGDPGAGKSTLARYLALALAEKRPAPALAILDNWRPILIELRDYALNCEEYETFGEYLNYRQRTDGMGIEQDTVESYLRQDGRVLVVFDGLDEIFEPRLRETVSRRIAGFAAQFPASRVVVTSRVVGYRPRVLRDAGFVQYTVQDLDPEKIDTFLRGWYELALHDRPAAVEIRRERLTRAIKDSSPIRELAGNPLLLTILAIIGKHQELPRERWKVYDHAASVLVQHWDVNKHLVDENIDADVIREDDKKELLRKLAIRMQEGSHGFAGNSLAETDLFEDIENYLIERFRYEPPKAAAISTVMVKQLRERNFIFARYGSGVYGFVHRALLEFFSAGDIVNRFEKTRTLSENDLVEKVFLTRSEDPAWAEVLRLIVGMVDAVVATRLVEHLLTSTGTHRSSALDQRPLAAVALAAQCIAEIRNVHAAATAAERTLGAVIELIESPVRSFGDDRRETHLHETVLPAMNAVSAWPGRSAFRDWFARSGRYATTAPAAKLGAQFLAALFPNDDQVREQLHQNARSGIPHQREAALLGLAQSWKSDSQTMQLVEKGLYDEKAFVRRTSLDLLVTHWPGNDRVREVMIRASEDPDASVRRRAIEALAQHATQVRDAWPTVIRALREDGAHTVRDAAVTALASDSANPQDTLALLLQACCDPAWQVRRSALRLVVARFATEPPVLERVLAATRDADEDVRQTAVESLASRWPEAPESASTVCRAVRDVDSKVRRAAVRAIARHWREIPEAASALKLAQTDYDGDIRVTALTVWTDPISQEMEYIGILNSIVTDDPVADARRAALEVLVSEAAEFSGPALANGMVDPDSEVRSVALRRLSGITPDLSHFRPAVVRLCEDAIDNVRQKAIEVAARFWGDRPEVVRILLRATRAESWQLRRVALESLAARWPDTIETRQALRRGRRDPSGSVRHTATTVMVSLGRDTRERAAMVEAATTDPYVWTRRWAASLLCALTMDTNGQPGADKESSEHPPMSEAALDAIARSEFDETAISNVCAATDHADADVRLTAYEIINARRGTFPGALNLITRASRDFDPSIRLLGLSALLAAWPEHNQTSVARRRGLTDPSDEIHRLALESSILREPNAPATRLAMTTAITANDWATRRLALDTLCLRWRDQPQTLSTLQAAMHHPDESIRQVVMDVLRGVWPNDESTFDTVASCVGDPAPGRRTQALRSLATGWPRDNRVRAFLETSRRDHISDVATAAWELQRGADDDQAFDDTCRTADLRHPDVVCRWLAADKLARRSPVTTDSTDLLRLGIRDTSEAVWSSIRFALLTTTDDQQVRSVLRTARVHPSYRARIINLQVQAGRWPASTESCAVLRDAMDDVDFLVRMTALNLLIEADPEAASSLDIAVRSSTDPDWEIRASALRLLTTCWSDESLTLDRLAMASRDYIPNNRKSALEALLVGWPRHPKTLAALTEAKTDVSVFVRDFARLTSTQLHPEPLPSTESVADPRSGALEQLRQADLQLPDDSASPQIVLNLTRSTDRLIRGEALQVLTRRWPDWTETHLALSRALDDDNVQIRQNVARELTCRLPDSSFAVPMLRRATRDSNWFVRYSAVQLLVLWRIPEAQAALFEAAKDQDLSVNLEAVKGLVAGWPADDNTYEALGWAVCSSFDWQHYLACERLSGRDSNEVPNRSTLLASRRVPELLLLAARWGEDPDVAVVLREHLPHHDILRAMTLTAILARSGDDPGNRDLLLSVMRDECPAVRRIALEGLIRMKDSAWTSAAVNDPDPDLRYLLTTFRSLNDKSPMFSTEIVEILRGNADSTFSSLLFQLANTRASTGLLDPAALAEATRGAPYLTEVDVEWLQWLVGAVADSPRP